NFTTLSLLHNLDDGNLQVESDSRSFWVMFGGFAPISKNVATDDDIVPESSTAQLYSITDGQVNPLDGELTKSIFENDKCYILDCGSESNFDSWPSGSTPAPEDGRGKVAALVKQQGADVKAASKSTSVDEEVPPLLEEGGLSSSYKNHIEENGYNDETYASDTVGLFRISGNSSNNNKAVQVDVLFSIHLAWKAKSHEQQNLAAKIVEF
uniref:Uncharacterized protein n=1 Tax=Solanum lycopersicum TaxID=4081 RepID=A0A3Q7I075_SOLLC